jgi:hypothetical protein
MAEPIPQPVGASEAPAEHLVYQPISLLAIAALGIAAAYGAVVLVGFLASLLLGYAWLMPLWTLLIPLAAGTLAWVARARINRSEGTLAGLALTRWGVTISLLVFLIQASYSAATYFVFRQQADSFARQTLGFLTAGEAEKAFVRVLPPDNRPPDGPNLRDEIEKRFNPPSELSRRGHYSDFLANYEVRLLQQGGPQTELKLLGMTDLDYVNNGYQVRLTYQVNAPAWSYELTAVLHGATSRGKSSQSRQWQLLMQGLQSRNFTATPHGNAMLAAQKQAQAFAGAWVNLLRTGDLQRAYLAVLPPAEREEINRTQQQLAAGTGSLAVLALPPEVLLPRFGDFTAGKLVLPPAANFWAASDTRDQALDGLKKLFARSGDGVSRSLEIDMVPLLPWQTVGGRLQVRQDVTVGLGGKLVINAALLLETDAKQAEALADGGPPLPWRVVGLEPTRVREAAPAPARGPQPLP